MRKSDLWVAPICEAALLLVAGVVGWAFHKPLLFSSLGPTAYELIETPERPSARAYNVFVGHLVGVISGFAGLYIFHASAVPGIAAGWVERPRIGAAIIAAALTVLLTLALRAAQPAAVATSLLIALGTFNHWQGGVTIMGAVAIMLIFGEPLRAWRLRVRERVPHQSASN